MKTPSSININATHNEQNSRPPTQKVSVKRFNSLIESIGVYLPSEVRTSSEVVANCRSNVPIPLEFMTGIRQRHCAGTTEFSSDLAAKAITDCLDKSKYTAADIDIIVCCNISRADEPGHKFSAEPTTAMKMKREFGLPAATLALDLNNACAGMFTGVYLVNSLVRSGSIRRGLVVSGEYITHLTDTAQREIKGLRDLAFACLTLGDSGAALLLDRTEDLRVGFQDIELLTVSEYSDLCVGEPAFRPEGGAIMRTRSTDLARNGIYHTARHNREMMDKNGWTANRTDHFITHQVSTKVTKLIRREFNKISAKDKVSADKMVHTVQETGNTSSTTHTLALHRSVVEGNMSNNERVVFSVSASGLTVGTALYQFDNLPERIQQIEAGGPLPEKHKSRQKCRHATGVEKALVSLESVAVAPADDELDSRQTASLAGVECLEKSRYDADDINIIVSAGIYKSGFVDEPSNAALIARDLKLNHNFASEDYSRKTFAFDLNAGSTGWLHSVFLAQEQVRANAISRVLVVASEADENRNVPGSIPLEISRVGTASLVHPSRNGEGFSNFFFESHDDYLDGFRSHVDGSSEKVFLCHEEAPDYADMLLSCLEKSLIKFLASLKDIELADFDYVVGPQFSVQFDSGFSELLNAMEPDERAGDRLVRYPDCDRNLATSSLACGLHTIMKKDDDLTGKRVLLCSAGSGIQTACAIYQF